MSRLKTLLDELCPDGVEYKKLGELGTFYGGLSGKSKEDFKDGNAKYITYMNVFSNIAVNTNIHDYVRVGEKEKQNAVKYGDVLFTGSSETPEECGMSSVLTEEVEEKLYLNSFCFGFRFYDPSIMLPGFAKFLFRSHAMRKQIIRTANGVTRFNVSKKKMESVIIPVPPLAVQCEIVRLLDNFAELTAELTAELSLRRTQYEHYRDTLLTFPAADEAEKLSTTSVRWLRLEDIAINCDSKRKPIAKRNRQAGQYPYYGASGLVDYVKEYIFDGDYLLVSEDGANLLARNTPIAFSISGKTWVNNHAHVLKFADYDMRRYVEFYLNSIDLTRYISTAAQPKLTQDNLNKIMIPIPGTNKESSAKQIHKIVSILDRFDMLCNDLTAGLPAEIEARRKQYAYYRDRLLTFREKRA